MRIAIIIEPFGNESTVWANLLDCERIIANHSQYIYENYTCLPDIMIFVPQNIFDYADEPDYFKIVEICRYHDMHFSLMPITENWQLYAVKSTIIKKRSRDFYISASSAELRNLNSQLYSMGC